ncbi:MAG: TetR/AcrR family transcriptional regulator [Ktedonobacteraceae bacterium]
MPRAEEAKQHQRLAQREHILEAAGKVFARKGLTATMDDIATAASISHGLAYRYFANKEALLQTVVEQAVRASPMRLQRLVEQTGTPGERLTLLVSWLVESRRAYPERFHLLDQMLNNETTPEAFRELVSREIATFLALMKQLIIEGQETSEVGAGDPDQLIRAILACLDGLTQWAVHHPELVSQHFPTTEILLRLLQPSAGQQ